MTDIVLLDELPTACGRRFGLATLNVPTTLNSLSLAVVQALTPALRRWADEPAIAGVVLQGAGEKAFCAGGDLRELYRSIRNAGAELPRYARDFFAQEYELDYLIHRYAKPILCWGHGIVMGGGIGLMAGASHRVVTSASRLAMPEITVGLYPDVGSSWFLHRMPGRVGLFLALTGAPLNAADALFCGLANFHLESERRHDVLAAIGDSAWSDDASRNRVTLGRLLARHMSSDPLESNLRRQFDVVNELAAGESLLDIATRLRAVKTRSEDTWLATAAATFVKGSPTSAALSFELMRRARELSLADVLRLEYDVSLGCCTHSDFVEGTRALLIDKDRNPRWIPASLDDVTPELIADHFRSRVVGNHPLAGLG